MSIKYPYTDFHEMNLDWTLETVKKSREDSAEALDTANATEERVNDFFDTLDLQEEVDNKLNEMADDGSLANIVNPVIMENLPPVLVDSVSDMVLQNRIYILKSDGHVYQYINGTFSDTGVVYGGSIGNVVTYMGVLASPNTLASLTTETIYFVSSSYYPSDVPEQTPGIVETLGGVSGAKTQTFTVFSGGKRYYRNYLTSWGAWDEETPVEFKGNLSAGADLNIIPKQTIFRAVAGSLPANCPSTIEGFVFTYGNDIRAMQFYKELHAVRMYYRRAVNNTWGNWTDGFGYSLQYRGAGHSGNYPISGGDLNNASGMSVYTINPGVGLLNMPTQQIGYLFTYGVDGAARTQVFQEYGSGALWYRHSTSNAAPLTWTAWQSIMSEGAGNPNARMFSIGNSILTGSVWLNGVYDHLAAYNNAPYGVMADAMRIPRTNVTHQLISSTGLLYDAGNGNFLTNIENTDITGYDVLLTHLWTGDMSYSLGSINSIAGDGSIAGAVIELVNYMRTNNGRCQLILVGVPPVSYSISGNNVFTGIYTNGKNLSECEALMRQLAALYHFTFIGWQDLNISYYYQDYTDGQNVHANNEDTYRLMGAYLGGRAGSNISF